MTNLSAWLSVKSDRRHLIITRTGSCCRRGGYRSRIADPLAVESLGLALDTFLYQWDPWIAEGKVNGGIKDLLRLLVLLNY